MTLLAMRKHQICFIIFALMVVGCRAWLPSMCNRGLSARMCHRHAKATFFAQERTNKGDEERSVQWRQAKSRHQRIVPFVIIICVTMFATFALSQPAFAASLTQPNTIGRTNVAAAAIMLLGLAVWPLGSVFDASKMARRLMLSASRCAVQVYLMGSVVLDKLMGVDQPFLVAAWIFGVGFVAGKEALSRVQFTYPNMRRHVYASVWSGGCTILAVTLGLRILGNLEPWFQPRTWIPIAGMLFGNTLSASALGASTITKNFATEKDLVEVRLARGATWREAVSPLLLDALSTALTPTINGLAVTGVVHIPGMMTGQILAGQSVSQAAMYQIVINFLIATTACTTVQLLMWSAIGALVDRRHHRLNLGVLSEKNKVQTKTTYGWRKIFQTKTERKKIESSTETIPISLQLAFPKSMEGAKARNADAIPTLVANALVVPRAMTCVSFKLYPGDRMGITGRSGAGKSQVLRSIAGLEASPAGSLELKEAPIQKMDLPTYRTHVCLVSQRIPAFQGTPHQLYEEILHFDRRKGKPTTLTKESPQQIAKEWGVSDRLFYQEWSSLSGGEAQRISLAIALSLRPDVLLLDESLSALDDATAKSVEATLLNNNNVSIIMVTHSESQLNRFCTHHLELNPVKADIKTT